VSDSLTITGAGIATSRIQGSTNPAEFESLRVDGPGVTLTMSNLTFDHPENYQGIDMVTGTGAITLTDVRAVLTSSATPAAGSRSRPAAATSSRRDCTSKAQTNPSAAPSK